ncbi:hypothetical protein HW555_013549 [Spodoptera exigua]|uniref:Uncharacterized protein n=1 Tax=Spodoptera exigua TaxID=7107 RepID=A0A835G2P1_SPOEX|nr:hypothetical protein HW555_013549 [Spodoptera exigua]
MKSLLTHTCNKKTPATKYKKKIVVREIKIFVALYSAGNLKTEANNYFAIFRTGGNTVVASPPMNTTKAKLEIVLLALWGGDAGLRKVLL